MEAREASEEIVNMADNAGKMDTFFILDMMRYLCNTYLWCPDVSTEGKYNILTKLFLPYFQMAKGRVKEIVEFSINE